jgi:hypothetical protein
MIPIPRITVVVVALATAVAVIAPSKPLWAGGAHGGEGFTRWTYQEDFTHGISGWMSYPLAQDVGYDPTLYTQQVGDTRVLVRDVTSYGQRLLRVGVARPIRFHASALSSLRLVYSFEACGKGQSMRLALGTSKGRRVTFSLPAQPGEHDAQVAGRQLELPVAGAEVEVIVVEAEVLTPDYGSHSRLTLHSIEVQAEKPPSLAIRSPEVERSPVDDVAVSRDLVTPGNPLKIQVSPGLPARVSIYSDDGQPQGGADLPSGNSAQTEVASPDRSGLYTAEIAGTPAKSDFRFLVLGKVPGHPRVLLTAERLAQLRSPSDSNDLPGIVHRRATELRTSLAYNSLAGRNILLLPTLNLLSGLPEYFAVMDAYSNAIAFNALDYGLGGDRQALDAARRALLTVSAWPTWTPPWFTVRGIHTYYEVGVFTQKVAFGFDLIADELSPDDKSAIAEALWKFSIRPTLDDYFFYDRLPIAVSNHEAQSLSGAIEACVALYGDVPDWKNKYGPALAELVVSYERLVAGLFPGDGSEAEPAGYENFAMEGLSWGMAALHAMGIRPRGYADMMQGFWWLRYAQVRPDLLLDTGDFGGDLPGHSGYAWGAEFAGDAALQAFYQTATNLRLLGGARSGETAQAAEKMPGLLDLVCCTQTLAAEPSPPSRLFPARGSAVLRSGWAPDDTVISIRVGPWFNHEHHDQGSILVAAHGEELIAEAGYTSYYQDPHYPDFFTQAPAHNTLTIDGDAFSQEDYDGRYWPAFQNFARFEAHLFSPGVDYLAADLAPAYRDGVQLRRLKREYVFIKPDVLVIHDRMEADEPHSYSWFLHVPPGAQASAGTVQAMIRRGLAVAAVTAGGDNTHWELEQQPVPTNAYHDLDRNPIEPRQTFRLDSSRERSSSFLVAMHFQKSTEAAPPFTPFRTGSGDGLESRQSASWTAAVFRRDSGPLTSGEISTDGDSLMVRKDDAAEEVLATEARSLQRGRQLIFSASPAVDVVAKRLPSGVELYLTCAGATDVRIFPERRVVELQVDQGRATPTVVAGFILLAHLTQGEHVVRITY